MIEPASTLTVHLGQLKKNVAAVRQIIGKRFFWGVVKANAYGLGAVPISKTLLNSGVDGLAVARIDEALELRKSGIAAPILLLGPLPRQLPKDPDLHVSVSSKTEWQRALDSVCKIHLNIDTGMSRLGFETETMSELQVIAQVPERIEGIWSHYSHADTPLAPENYNQQKLFKNTLQHLRACGVQPRHIHLANSAGLALLQQEETSVRVGLYLYGAYPWQDKQPNLPDPNPAICWEVQLEHLRKRNAGVTVSYQGQFVTNELTTLATVAVGYADGLVANHDGLKLCDGQQMFPVRGRVTMDLCVVELPPEHSGTGSLCLLGPVGADVQMTIEQFAKLTQRLPYECLTAIGNRVQRLYVD